MYYRRVLRSLTLLAALLGLTTLSASPVAAAALSLPEQFSHAGLTFDSPLTFTDAHNVPILHLSFTPSEVIAVKRAKARQVLVEQLVTPIPKKLVVKNTASLPNLVQKAEAAEIPTATPTQPPVPTPTAVPATTAPVQLSNGGLNADTLFDMSNSYRTSHGLPAFQKDDRACQLAASRAPEIQAEIDEGHMHSGLRARNLPYWNSENIITMRTEAEAFNWWINDKIHYDQIMGNYTFSCVACAGHACAQEFTNFQPK